MTCGLVHNVIDVWMGNLMDNKIKKSDINKFIIMLIIIDVVMFLTNFKGKFRSYNTTMLALSYRNGFTSRSLLGTIYHGINNILPVDMMSYEMAILFAEIVTGLFFLFIIYFSYRCMQLCHKKYQTVVQYLLLLLSIFIIPTFSYPYNFLRVDLFMVWVSMIAILVLAKGKHNWIVIILACLGMMFHQGYVFMYFNVILVALFYQILSDTDKKERGKNIIVFILTFVLGSALFVWFELLGASRANGMEFFETVRGEAESLSYNGIYHSTLLYHEILGIDLSASEVNLAKANQNETPVFVLLILPYIILLVKFLFKLFKGGTGAAEKWKYLAMAFGSFTLLPDFLLKVDYGRWMMALVFYYAGMMLFLVLKRDRVACPILAEFAVKIKSSPWYLLFMVAPIFFVPFMDVNIDQMMRYLGTQFGHFKSGLF